MVRRIDDLVFGTPGIGSGDGHTLNASACQHITGSSNLRQMLQHVLL
jgi:hypothetical protein